MLEEPGPDGLEIVYDAIWTFVKAFLCKFKRAGGCRFLVRS